MGQVLFSFLGVFCFSYIFNIPRGELVFAGFTGVAGWMVYLLAFNTYQSPVVSTFLAVLVVTAAARILSIKRKTPITVFLVGGIIPLVPGAGVYSTMYGLITDNLLEAAYSGVQTVKIAGVISIGIIAILSLPQKIFAPGIRGKKE